MSRMRYAAGLWVALVGCWAVSGESSPSLACERAWADYEAFKDRNTMQADQYPLTLPGAAVRAACGPQALPVPPGSDTPPAPRVRKPRPPAVPAPPASRMP